MMSKANAYEGQIADLLEKNKAALNDISQELWKHPELMYEEVRAHELLTNFLEKHEFKVAREYHVKTAFRAEFQSSHYDKSVHPTVAIICEYDGLPEIGHACGHNLIAEAGVAAGLAVQEVLRNRSNQKDPVEGRVVVLGTPAEEGGGGKVDLIRAGAFDDIDFAMMVHPYPCNDLEPIILGIERCYVKYHGKAAHASCGPWEGINALDAAVATYHSVSLFRQQMKPNWRIHGIIINGGAKPNIIPDLTVSHYYMRTQSQTDMERLKAKMLEIFNASAKATGCTMEIEWEGRPYTGMMHNSTMSQLYKQFASAQKVNFPQDIPGFYGSTDMGNVSLVVPSIHPCIFIGQSYLIHTKEMAQQAGSAEAQPYVLTAAKTMALTSIELFLDKELREKSKAEFHQKKKSFAG